MYIVYRQMNLIYMELVNLKFLEQFLKKGRDKEY